MGFHFAYCVLCNRADVHSLCLQVMLNLIGGIGLSLVNSIPEELVYISLQRIHIDYCGSPISQTLEVTVNNIQVGRQWLCIAALRLWNALPGSITDCKSIAAFKICSFIHIIITKAPSGVVAG